MVGYCIHMLLLKYTVKCTPHIIMILICCFFLYAWFHSYIYSKGHVAAKLTTLCFKSAKKWNVFFRYIFFSLFHNIYNTPDMNLMVLKLNHTTFVYNSTLHHQYLMPFFHCPPWYILSLSNSFNLIKDIY